MIEFFAGLLVVGLVMIATGANLALKQAERRSAAK
jgi:hypothetical protein